jgi:hypothetical protein
MKMKLKEFVLESEKGGKVTVSFDGSFTPEAIMEILGKFQDNSSGPENQSNTTNQAPQHSNDELDSKSIREKLELIVNQIKYGWFTSDHVRELYQNQFREEIKPSTVSTYLARLFNENTLERRGSRAKREYHLVDKQVTPIEYIKTN